MIYGIDFGNLKSRVAVTRRGGVDVILNELSARDSASYVSYTPSERFIGEKGFDQAIRNQNNTVHNLKRFMGLYANSPQLEYERQFCTCDIQTSEQDVKEVQFEVQYEGTLQRFYPQQVLAALLGRLHSYVELDGISSGGLPIKGTDCVVSCPVYYTIHQRKALLQATEIAHLNCMALLNESTAIALDYGIFKSTSFPEYKDESSEGTVVLFMDIGHSATTISATSFWKGSMRVLGSVYNIHLGTREIDQILLEYFQQEILKKYHMDVFENKRARFRLLQAIEKMKVMLSANPVSNLNVECLMNDQDIAFQGIRRDEMEHLIAKRFLIPLEELCMQAQEQFKTYILPTTNIEIVGGGSRMPCVKQIIHKIFGVSPSTTLVATESIAKGCAILAAMLSPKFKVREYTIQDRVMWNIQIGYHALNPSKPSSVSFQSTDQINKVIPLFKRGEIYPKSLDLTFERTEDFTLYYFYDEQSISTCQDISQRLGPNAFSIGQVQLSHIHIPSPPPISEAIAQWSPVGACKVRIRFRLSFTGMVEIEQAFIVQEFQAQEHTSASEKATEAGVATEGTNPTAPKKDLRKEVKIDATREIQMQIAMLPEAMVGAIQQEEKMVRKDQLVSETLEAKNALEGYAYDHLNTIENGGILSAYLPPDQILLFQQYTSDNEQWLCSEEGDVSSKEEYQRRLSLLKDIMIPAQRRKIQYEDRNHEWILTHKKMQEMKQQIEHLHTSGCIQENWIQEQEIQKIQKELIELEQWIQTSQQQSLSQVTFYQEAEITHTHIRTKWSTIESMARPILTRKKPTPTPASTSTTKNTSEEFKEGDRDGIPIPTSVPDTEVGKETPMGEEMKTE